MLDIVHRLSEEAYDYTNNRNGDALYVCSGRFKGEHNPVVFVAFVDAVRSRNNNRNTFAMWDEGGSDIEICRESIPSG